MNSEHGGLSSYEKQQKTSAEIARRKVLASFDSATTNTGKLKDQKIDPTARTTVSQEDWKKYHTAWQNYYQNYYNTYYSNAARQYIAKEKQKAEQEKSSQTSKNPDTHHKAGKHHGIFGSATSSQTSDSIEKDIITKKLRDRIRSRASDAATMSRRRKKLLPILAGLTVVIVLLFLQYNRLIFAPIAAYVSPGDSPASEITAINPSVSVKVSSDPKLIIPKLNIEVPVAFGISNTDVMTAMNDGVAHYRINGANAFPGEVGNTVITGHSAGDIYSNNQYKFIFSGLERLENGDLIYINYNSTRYTYRVTGQEVVEPTNVSALVYPTDKPILTLITCTPLGTSRYRLLVTAEQISPSTDTAPTSSPTVEENTQSDLPSNEPSFFEGIWNFITGNH